MREDHANQLMDAQTKGVKRSVNQITDKEQVEKALRPRGRRTNMSHSTVKTPVGDCTDTEQSRAEQGRRQQWALTLSGRTITVNPMLTSQNLEIPNDWLCQHAAGLSNSLVTNLLQVSVEKDEHLSHYERRNLSCKLFTVTKNPAKTVYLCL